MNEYQVEIKETLAMTVTVEAQNAAQAQDVVERRWKDSEFILDADNFKGVTFRTMPDRDRER
ncbi:MAG: DpnD/PcfM family protein [Ethanoligenens sp.]